MNSFFSVSTHILGLPLETKLSILSYLAFGDILHVSRVCQELRYLCLAEHRLWQEFPPVTMSTLHVVTPYFARAGKLGRDLCIDGIKQAELGQLSQLLLRVLPVMRSLRLNFAVSSEWHLVDIPAMQAMWHSLTQPAPLLESLELVTDDLHDPIHTVPYNAFGGVPLPKLRFLAITAFQLEEPCLAFAHVEKVKTCVTVLAPFAQSQLPTLANPDWENRRLHEHFPAIRSLLLLAIEPHDGDELAHSIIRLPFIDEPLEHLHLAWDDDEDITEDPITLRWMEQCASKVMNLSIEYPESLPVCDAALLSLAAAGEMALRIVALHEGLYQLIARSTTGRQRVAVLYGKDVAAALERILRHPLVVISAVWIPSSDGLFRILAQHWHCPPQAFLGITVGSHGEDIQCSDSHGSTIIRGVRTLGLQASTGFILKVQEAMGFVAKCTPDVNLIRVNGKVMLINPEALPATVALELHDDE